jgi:hypothetical protein
MRWILAATLLACGGRTDLGERVEVDGGLPPEDASGLDIAIGDVVGPPDVGIDSLPPVDAGPPPGIQCGTDICNPQTEVCCVTFGGMMIQESCTDPMSCGGAALTCSSAQSCPMGEVCCGFFMMGNAGSKCEPMCKGGFQNPQLCATDAECPMGQTCKNSPFGFKTCR